MKINSPVTQQEVFLQPSKPIVSKTDLKGIITYVNQNFIDISGFNRDELIGKSHNIVRHPDMPPEAFAWLWDTLKQDLPWRGLVKNRCKNGDFYWVEAHVTPIKENGRTIGYMSVRNVPVRNEVNTCESLYAGIRDGSASLPKRGFRLYDISFYTRLNIISSLLFLLLGGSSLYYLIQADSLVDHIVAAISGMGAILTVAAFFWFNFTFKKFLGRTSNALENIAEGNLAFSINEDNRDEFGMALNEIESMRINLRAIIADVSLSAKLVDSKSNIVVNEMQKLLLQSLEQSDRTNSISAATEEIHQSIEQASDLTKASAKIASEAETTVKIGNKHMQSSIESIERIVKVVNTARAHLMNLHGATQRIGTISLAIKDVAEQTNLLALNAAIEAARAGEQGRGFAVVADEVRKLAERTASSTMDITETVQNIHQITTTAVNTMDNAVTEVEQGTQLIYESKNNLAEILKSSNKELEMANEISVMLQEQAAATEEIAQNMHEISSLTSSSTAGVSNTKVISEDLSNMANELELLIKHFEKSL